MKIPEKLNLFGNILNIGVNENNYNVMIDDQEYNISHTDVPIFWLTYFDIHEKISVSEITGKYGPIVIEMECKSINKEFLFEIYDYLCAGIKNEMKYELKPKDTEVILFRKNKEKKILFYFHKIYTNRKNVTMKIINYSIEYISDKKNIVSLYIPPSIELFFQKDGFTFLSMFSKNISPLGKLNNIIIQNLPTWDEISEDIIGKDEKTHILEKLKQKYAASEINLFPFILSIFVNERRFIPLKNTFTDYTKHREDIFDKFFCKKFKRLIEETCDLIDSINFEENCKKIVDIFELDELNSEENKYKLSIIKNNLVECRRKYKYIMKCISHSSIINKKINDEQNMTINIIINEDIANERYNTISLENYCENMGFTNKSGYYENINICKSNKVKNDLLTIDPSNKKSLPIGIKETKNEKPEEIINEKSEEIKNEKPKKIKNEKPEEIKNEKPEEIKNEKPKKIKNEKSEEIKNEKPEEIKNEKPEEIKNEKPKEIKNTKKLKRNKKLKKSMTKNNEDIKKSDGIIQKKLISNFFEENLEKDENNILSHEDLFNFYKDWSKNENLYILSLASFNRYVKTILPNIKLNSEIIKNDANKIQGHRGINIKKIK